MIETHVKYFIFSSSAAVYGIDQFFNSTLISQLINGVMVDGKKSLAARIVYESLEKIRKTTKEDRS